MHALFVLDEGVGWGMDVRVPVQDEDIQDWDLI